MPSSSGKWPWSQKTPGCHLGVSRDCKDCKDSKHPGISQTNVDQGNIPQRHPGCPECFGSISKIPGCLWGMFPWSTLVWGIPGMLWFISGGAPVDLPRVLCESFKDLWVSLGVFGRFLGCFDSSLGVLQWVSQSAL